MKTNNKGVYIKVLKNNNRLLSGYYSFHIVSLAERGGFEPPKPFWGLLAFQAGQFNHSCIFPFAGAKIETFAQFRNYFKYLLWR